MRSIISMPLKALSLLLILVFIFPLVSGHPKKPCAKPGDKNPGGERVIPRGACKDPKFPRNICTTVKAGTEDNEVPDTGIASPPGGGQNPNDFPCGNLEIRFPMCCTGTIPVRTGTTPTDPKDTKKDCRKATPP
ncbi:hypothetical protein PTTG_12153 [Puccinia triticina 1-1 BBBD Race 1]|uniref:Hydrophobin n=2 Tax=Puccinia triticina TaxID=208348 RepID=A0A180GMU2_PUCT1|nr:uncharacterized protein PtA15_1A975 [Puccinia triticina]OAV94127.1 hypothetical protein PTTG_12153 [Puccinia triticina 1-1 BBBD Race 1]WAQ81633.1 hypothetical protein PtA15_1A975 [Puccinia triticina]WAR52521.1 hypothetical protein PtB15_1B963 [Puccinia triticina]